MHKPTFTDTNLSEQLQPVTDIDWLDLAGCDCATFIEPQAPSFAGSPMDEGDLASPVAWLSSLRKTESHAVRFGARELKHTLQIALPAVHVHFPHFGDAKGFELTYCAVASNHPRAFEGGLGVRVAK